MLHFADNYYGHDGKESIFAVRVNHEFCGGHITSPFAITSERKLVAWNKNAKSVYEDTPIRHLLTRRCRGIFCVPIYNFINGIGIYTDYLRELKNRHNEQYRFVMMLIEYCEEDIVMRSKDEDCVSRCNVIFRCEASEFFNMIDDRSMFGVIADFVINKNTDRQLSPPVVNDLACDAVRYMEHCKFGQKENLAFEIYQMVFDISELSEKNIRREVEPPAELWFALIKIGMTKGLARNGVVNYIDGIRAEYMGHINDEHMKVIVDAVIESLNPTMRTVGNCDEYVLCDVWYLTECYLYSHPINREDLKSMVYRELYDRGEILAKR